MNLVAKMRAQRESWVELDEPARRAVLMRRPSEIEILRLGREQPLETAKAYVVGWRGFTEADLLGAGVGASDEVPFDADVWAEYATDHAADTAKVVNAVMERVNAHLEAVKAARGN